jgi:cytochrome c peroxidase
LTPGYHLGINETIISLESLQFVYENSVQQIVISKDQKIE